MIFFELKAAIQSRIWDIMHRNNWHELDEFSITLSDKLARKMVTSQAHVDLIISNVLPSVKTNFFRINNITKEDFTHELTEELGYVHELFKPPRIRRGKKKREYSAVLRRDFSEETKLEVLRKQDHRCALCRRLLNVVDYDHIDGDRSNNDISNCQAICPYCHAIKSRKKQSERVFE
jgi:hypothetical protein